MWWAAAALAAELEGTVTDLRGDPVPYAVVGAYDLRLGLTVTTAGADGRYAFDLPPGGYRVRAIAPAGVNLAERYHPDVHGYCAAPVVLAPAVADVTLPAGGLIRGLLVDDAGAPVAGAVVTAALVTDGFEMSPRTAISSATGAFEIAGVTGGPGPADFSIEVARSDLPTQYFPGVYAEELAEPVAVGEGGEVDVGTAVLHAGVTVAGQVTGPTGPVAAGTVQAYVPSQLRSVPIVDGAYLAEGLPPGDVLVWALADGLATTYWPDVAEPLDRYAAVEGEIAILDLELPPEAVLTGRLPGAGPFSGTVVVAYNPARTVGIGAAVEEDGTFTIGRLSGGEYTLSVFAEGAGLVEGEVVDAAGAAVVFDVAVGGLLDVGELQVPAGGALAGVVTDLYTGEPVHGAVVFAQERASGEIAAADSEADGSWEILGVPPGEYELFVEYQAYCYGDPDWAPRWYPDTPTDTLTVSVTVTAGDRVEWDVAVAPDVDQDGMDDVWEAANGLDPTVADGAGDLDGDGFTNIEEYQLGTDPAAVAKPEGCGCANPGRGNGVGAGWLAAVALLAVRRRG